MGASKRLMEHVIFSGQGIGPGGVKVTSARFANVAFSDGSLLQGWLMRLAKGQPLAVPRETRRYFVSLEEAGQICLLASFLAPDRHLLVPRLDASSDLIDLSELAVKTLQQFGYAPRVFEVESAAREAAAEVEAGGYYPLLLTPLDTSGEKPYEEFVGAGEESVDVGLEQLIGVPYVAAQPEILSAFLEWVETMLASPAKPVGKEELVCEMQKVLPEFHHIASAKTLDQRL
jgi:FlaA1/EpsC-like NDP-sugar epimerase